MEKFAKWLRKARLIYPESGVGGVDWEEVDWKAD
jgi:hypothetical protein